MPVPGDNHPDMPDRDRSSIPTYEDACAESVEGRYPALRSGDGDGLSGYRPPTVESARSSTDTDFLVEDDMVSASEGSDPRRDMEQMEMLDPEHPMWGSEGGRVRITISKSLASITNTLSSLQSRLRFSRPSFGLSSLARIRVPDLYLPNLSVVVRLIVLFSVVALVYSFFVFQIFPSSARRQTFSEESLRSFLQGSIDEDRMRESLRYISSFEHIAGSEGGLYLTRWVEDLFRSYGLDSMQTLEYTVYLTYPRPRGRQVAITSPDELKWEATLEEESVYKDPSPHQKQSPSFHGLSKAGDVSGPLIYANTGSEEDFAQLTTWGINTAGSIILVKAQHGRLTEGLQLAAAEKAGAVGCLVYSDPGDDGAVDGATWPDGRKRPSDSLKRGSAGLTSRVLGDVLTPGWSSHIAASTRLTADEATGLANIPSLPLASRDAQRLLQAIKGKGRPVSADWIGAVPEVGEWWTGDASSAVVRLRNEQDEASQQLIYNVVGQIQGAETGFQKVIVGNHRDAWCFGSANPGSGTAVMLEVARLFGQLVQQGWKPLRTIEFASWDGGEYNLMGSTEYVEYSIDYLRENAVAYVNVDAAVSGDQFRAQGSPLLERSLLRVLDRVDDPVTNVSLRSSWDSSSQALDGFADAGDYLPFQALAGCASIDLGYAGHDLPSHSCYETMEWMERFGDPDFHRHKAVAQVLALLVLQLADEPLLSCDLRTYAAAVRANAVHLADFIQSRQDRGLTRRLDVASLHAAADRLVSEAAKWMQFEDEWMGRMYAGNGRESPELYNARIRHNGRMTDFDSHLLDLPSPTNPAPNGIPGREQYKHILYGPKLSLSMARSQFPAVRDAVLSGDLDGAVLQLEKVTRILNEAIDQLGF